MSPQKKPAAKPAAKKVSKKVSAVLSRKIIRKVSSKPREQAPEKLSPIKHSSFRLTEDIVDKIGAGIYLVQKGKFVLVSSSYEKLTGYDAADLIGKNLLALIHAADRNLVKKNTTGSLKNKIRDIYEYRLIKNNGDVMWVLETDSSCAYKGAPAILGSIMDITCRKLAQDSLQNLEDKYRTILEEINEGYGEIDLAGNWTFVNEAMAASIGHTPEELIGANFRQYTDENSAQKLFELYRDVYKTGQPFKGIQIDFIAKQGNKRIIEISGALIRDQQGQPVGFRGPTRDVTERRWSEDALLQSEAKYFSIIESIGEAYFETDLTGTNTFVNDKVCEDLGYTRNELLRMSNRDQQDDANARKTYAAFNKIYKTGLPINDYEYEAIRKDGTKAVFQMSISLMRDAEGNPIGFRGLAHDITERKEMEDALKASEERARTIIATIPDPYMESDLRGRVTYVNAAYISLMDYTIDELQTIHFTKYLDDENAKAVVALYSAVYRTGMPMKNVELEFIAKSGKKILVNLSVSLIRDPQGNPAGFHGIMRDITQKRKAEELIRQSEQSLREYSETLELHVAERTAELEKAKVAAEVASRAKSDFMASMSHEFQTPLNAVIGFTKVLQDRMFGDLNEKQEEFIRYIAEAGTSLSRLITEILDASHAASGHAILNLSSVSIVDALSKTIRLLTQQIEEKKQVLTVDAALDTDISIEADAQKIQQVLFHVLSNAVKYTAAGGKIHVRAAQTADPVSGQEGIRVAIEDTGTGIKVEDIPKLFQTFGTLQSPYTRSENGIGIGLSLTKQLVELHGGNISVDSEYGSGSCFTIFLPLKQKQKGSME